jgi:hypothetical protein
MNPLSKVLLLAGAQGGRPDVLGAAVAAAFAAMVPVGAQAQAARGNIRVGSLMVPTAEWRKLLRHTSSLVLKPPEAPANVKTIVDVYWSPSCIDCMRFFGRVLKPAVEDGATFQKAALVLHAFPRGSYDVAAITKLVSVQPANYCRTVAAAMQYGARIGRPFNAQALDYVLAKAGGPPDPAFEPRLAQANAEALNEYGIKTLGIRETPSVFINGRLLGDHRSVDLAKLKQSIATGI